MHDTTAHRHRRRRDRRAFVPGDRGGPRVAAPVARSRGQFCGNGSRHREPSRAARRFRARRAPQFRAERYVGHVTDPWIGAAAAERRRRVDDRVAPPTAARDRCWRVQLGSGRPGGGASPAFRRSCSSRTRFRVSRIGGWRRLSAPRLSRSSRRCRTSGGGDLSQAIRFDPSSLTWLPRRRTTARRGF